MCLTPRASNGNARFAITLDGGYGEQGITSSIAVPTGQWAHVAVTLSGTTATLYINGNAVGSNTSTAFAPWQLGGTTQNLIGRSQYSADPYFNGKVDDFRIYNGALSAAKIVALAEDVHEVDRIDVHASGARHDDLHCLLKRRIHVQSFNFPL